MSHSGLGILRKLGRRLSLKTKNKKAPAGQRKMRSRWLVDFFVFLGQKNLKVGVKLMKAIQ